MVSADGFTLTEALTRFVAARRDGKHAPIDHQELGRFVAWCGRARNVGEVSPAEVAEYAQYIGLGGPDSAHRLDPVRSFLTYWKQQGWTQSGLATHLRISRGRRGSGRRPGTSHSSFPEGIHLSQEGFDRLGAQLDVLKEERTAVTEDIKRAMEDKDFRENAPLEAAKERQGIIESRIRELENTLATAQLLSNKPKGATLRSTVGSKMTLKDHGSGRQIVYTLVDVREADAASGKISTSSPVGQALLDKAVGEEVTVKVPRGTQQYLIQRIQS